MKMNLVTQPTECTLYLTDVCNFSCVGCRRQTVEKPKHKEVDLELVKKILQDYPALHGFCIAGYGEPSLSRNFVEVVNYLLDNDKYVGIITNGTYPARFQELKKSPNYISISLYGYNAEQYKEYVGVNVFNKLKENFKSLKKIFGNVGFSYFLNKDNYKRLDKILTLCDELQPAFLNLANYLAYDSKETEDTKKIIKLSDVDIIKYIENRCDTRKYINARPIYLDENDKEFNCPSYGYVINLDGQGNIGGCQRQIPPSISYGNILLEDDPYNNVQMQMLRGKINEDHFPHYNCNSCFGRMDPIKIRSKVNSLSNDKKIDLAIMILFHEKVDQTIECLKSFIPSGQKIYILNNGSTKESVNHLRKFCNDYKQIKILDSEVNLGVSVGRNYLLQHTIEEWMFFVDNDIYITSNEWFKRFIVHLKNNPNTEVFIPKLFNLHENSYVTYYSWSISDEKIEYLIPQDNKMSNFPGGASIISRKIYRKLGLYDDKMFVGFEDFEFAIRGLLNNTPINAMLVDDIELVHDHKKIVKSVDKKAVLERYNEEAHQRSLERIHSKYPNLNFQHEWRNWVKEQKNKLLENEEYDLYTITPEYNFGARTKSRTIVAKNNPPSSDKFTTQVKESIKNEISKNKFSKVIIIQAFPHPVKFEDVELSNNSLFFSLTKDTIINISKKILQTISKDDKLLIILDHILEKLEDPRIILREIKKLLLLNTVNTAKIISKGRTKFGIEYPDDETSFREWREDELKVFLSSSGFIIKNSNSFVDDDINILNFDISLTEKKYEEFLLAIRLPKMRLSYLVCSNEHGKANLSGGIGSYVEEAQKLFKNDEFGVLLVSQGKMLPAPEILLDEKIITFNRFFDQQVINRNEIAEMLLKSIQVMQYFYPHLNFVEVQDVEGFGYRLAQAKRSGILSQEIMIQICAHGSKIYLENATQRWLDSTAYEVIHKERIALENADRLLVPTKFVYKLYEDAGYVLNSDRVNFIRLPFTFNKFPENRYRDIDTLIFYGKRYSMKGYDVFAEVVALLDMEGFIGEKIKRIILIGPYFPEMKKQNAYFNALKSRIEVLETSTFRKEAIRTIMNFHTKSICILPYKCDNHPYSVLELLETGCPYIFANTGGIPELLPGKYNQKVLSNLDPEEFSSKVKEILSASNNERYTLFSSIFKEAINLQAEFNKKFVEFNKPDTDNILNKSSNENRVTSSLIACTNVDVQEYNSTLLRAINYQTVLPDKLIIVCKGDVDKDIIRNSINEKIKVEFLNFKKNYNYSKNIILELIDTDIVVVLADSDIPKNDFIEKYTAFFMNNKEAKCVSSYVDVVSESKDLFDTTVISKQIKPLGEIGILDAQNKNVFAHESSAFITDFIKSLNGWEEKALSEDDLFTFVKIKSNNGKIGIITKSLVIRIEKKSTLTLKDDFNSQMRFAANSFSLDKFDAYRLSGLLRNLKSNQSAFDKSELSETEKQLITIQTLLLSGMIFEAKTILDNMDSKEINKCNKEILSKVMLIKSKVEKIAEKLTPVKTEVQEKMPLVSVIVPTYNRPNQLKETLSSVISQSYKNLEIIVVNDAGKDVADIIASLKDKRIKYIVHKKNKGLAGTRNTGMQNANGKYISFLDDDDIFYTNHIEVLVGVLRDNNVKVVYSDANRCLQKKEGEEYVTVNKELQYSFDYSQRFLFVLNIAPVQCFLFEKSCVDGDIKFDESLTTHEDWEFWIKLSLKNDFLHIKEITSEYRHRVDKSNMVTTKLPDFLRTMKIIYNRYADFTKDDPEILLQQKIRISELEKQILNDGYINPVSVIVVTYNSAKDISNCLSSLALTLRGKDEVIIVDNKSSDDTNKIVSAFIKNRHNFKFIQNQKNIGFSAGTNVGINASVNSYLVLLNPDTVAPKGWIESLLYHLEKDDTVGAVGPVSNYVAGLQKMELYLKEKLNGSLTIDQIFNKIKSLNDGVSIETKLLTGFCFMIKKDVIQKLGMLDEKLFLGNDDLDLCWRLRLNNYKLLVAADTFVYHKGQQSFKTEKKSKTVELVQQSTNALYLKLKEYYGENKVPTPLEIWGMDWFKPGNAKFNAEAKIIDEAIKQSENKNGHIIASIIVATYNQLEFTKVCLDSIIKHSSQPYEIIIVDNSSTDGTKEYLKNISEERNNIKVIYNGENLGFPKAINQAIALVKGKYIVLVNNDIVVTQGWLKRMIEVAESDEKIGVVGPISNLVSGLQKDAGAKYKSIEEMHQYAAIIQKSNQSQTIPFPRVAFLCTLIKSEVIGKIGGLDERFSPGNYEDDDFCLRAQLVGYKTVIAKDVFIHHFGSKSFKAEGDKKYSDRLKTNEKIFIDKWGATPDEIWIKGKDFKNRNLHFPVKEDLFAQYFERAKIHIEEKEYKFAQDSFEKAIGYYNSFERKGYYVGLPDVLDLAGNVSLITGKLEKAKEYFEEELKLNPLSSSACVGLGEFFYLKEIFESAKTMFQWAINNDSENAIAMEGLIKANHKLGLQENHNSLLNNSEENILKANEN